MVEDGEESAEIIEVTHNYTHTHIHLRAEAICVIDAFHGRELVSVGKSGHNVVLCNVPLMCQHCAKAAL